VTCRSLSSPLVHHLQKPSLGRCALLLIKASKRILSRSQVIDHIFSVCEFKRHNLERLAPLTSICVLKSVRFAAISADLQQARCMRRSSQIRFLWLKAPGSP